MVQTYLVTDSGVKPCPAEELEDQLRRPDVVVWVDIPRCDGRTALTLSETFGFHDIAIRDCLERNHMSKLHVYDDHVFTVLHAPQIGSRGHVHYVELDQFLGPNYLVTVHGPLNPVVDPEVAFLDTDLVLRRIERRPAASPVAVRVVLGDRVRPDPPGDRPDRDPGQTVR